MGNDFTLQGYQALLEALVERGYEVRDFDETDPARKHLVLRHDVDMSLKAAVAMAELENSLGVSSTYFVLLRTELYNPFSAKGLQAIRRISELGHTVGLHFDASLYGDDRVALNRAASLECTILESLVEHPVTVVSLHRPGKSSQGCMIQGTQRALGGRRHADEPLYFEHMGYCSDSRGEWHYGHPLEHKAVAEGRALQLVTHPIWWVGRGADPSEKLKGFLRRRYELLDQELAANCVVHKPAGIQAEVDTRV